VWAESVFDALTRGRSGKGQMAAELLQAGVLPAGTMPEEAGKAQVTELAARRRRALLFYESLELLLGETLACRERGAAWRPRTAGATEVVRRAATVTGTGALLAAIARIEQAKHEIDGNLNIGLVTAVMLQELGDHVGA
jgi:hypothetical protein